jgi:hypothetical protein
LRSLRFLEVLDVAAQKPGQGGHRRDVLVEFIQDIRQRRLDQFPEVMQQLAGFRPNAHELNSGQAVIVGSYRHANLSFLRSVAGILP